MKPLILTHNDMDGWCAGAIARVLLDAEVRTVQYGTPCPVEDAAGRDVFVLDFSWPADEMAQLAAAAKQLVWVDHHPGPIADEERFHERLGTLHDIADEAGVAFSADCILSLRADRCGAWLTYEHLWGPGDARRPPIVDLVDDHDRWVHAIQDTKPVLAALHALVGDEGPLWKGWGPLLDTSSRYAPKRIRQLVDQGAILLIDRAARVRKAARQAIPMMLDGHSAMMVNAPPDIVSDLGAALCEQPGVTIGWIWSVGVQRGEVRVFHSLRSAPDGPEVNSICARRGGGGHPHAAGWSKALTAGLLRIGIMGGVK